MLNRSLLQIHLATFLFGFVGPISGMVSAQPATIAAGRAWSAMLVMLALLLIQRQSPWVSSRSDAAALAGLGVIQALQWLTFFAAVKTASVAVALVSVFTFPLFVTLLEPPLFGTQRTRSQIIGSVVILLSVMLIVPEFSMENSTTRGAVWGIVSALLVAASLLAQRKYIQQYSSTVLLTWKHSVSALVLLPFLGASGEMLPAAIDLWPLVAIGTLFTAVPHLFMTRSLQLLRAQKVSTIVSLELVYGVVLAAILARQIPTWQTATGGLLILAVSIRESLSRR